MTVAATLPALLERSARRLPERTALVCGNRRMSYRELLEEASAVAADMRFRGLERGDRVVVLLPNCPAALIAVHGTLLAGGAFSVVGAGIRAGKLASILANAEPSFVITDAAGLATLSAIPEHLPRRGVYVTGTAPPDAISFEGAIRRKRALAPVGSIDLDLAAIIYTSGTTSAPKGVAMTHRNMVSAAASIQDYLQLQPRDRILSVLPLSFDYGLYQALLACQVGACLILRDGFGFPFELVRAIADQRVSVLPCVPTLMAMLLRLHRDRSRPLDSVEKITNTGAALPASFVGELATLFPRARIFSMYGLTECKRVSWLSPEELGDRPDSVGKPIANTEVWVVDEEGEARARSATGELVVRGSHVMAGYWREPEATAAVLRPGRLPGERVLHTGDLFRIDDQGYLYFLGRLDEVFKSRGERVSPREIEAVLYALPGVTAARVRPVPDPILGNAIEADVVCPGGGLTPADAAAHCRRHLEERLVPRRIDFLDALPVSAAGKVLGASREP